MSSPAAPGAGRPTESSKTTAPSQTATSIACIDLLPFPVCALTDLDAVDDFLEAGFDDHSAHDHLAKHCMESLEPEDEVELAHILEQSVERLDENLDEVEQR